MRDQLEGEPCLTEVGLDLGVSAFEDTLFRVGALRHHVVVDACERGSLSAVHLSRRMHISIYLSIYPFIYLSIHIEGTASRSV